MQLSYKKMVLILVILFMIITISFCLSGSINANYYEETGNNVFIEPMIVNKLASHPDVSVIVVLNDSEKTVYSGPMSSRYKIFEENKKYFDRIEKNVISTLSESDFKVEYKFALMSAFGGYVTKSGLEKLKRNPNVIGIYGNKHLKLLLQDSVPLINADDVWPVQMNGINITGIGTTICVIDSGINWSHPDLGGCFGAGCKVVGGYNFLDNNTNVTDSLGHGTHVAGIVAANGGIKGVAPDAKLVAMKVCNESGCYSNAMAYSVDWCVNNSQTYNISIITMSIGGDTLYTYTDCEPDDPINKAINNAYDDGFFISVSSGNDYFKEGITSPACARGSTSVGAIYKNDTITDYSNLYEYLDLLAPGGYGTKTCNECNASCCPYSPGGINSTASTGGDLWTCWGNQCGNSNNKYIEVSGTSMAAPHVAGAAALLVQYEKMINNRTEFLPGEIEERLKKTGKSIMDTYTNFTFPRVDVYSALFSPDVSDLQVLNISSKKVIYGFKMGNRYFNQSNISWSFDTGNEIINNTQNIVANTGKDIFVYFENNYTDGDIYLINATAYLGNLSDSETMTISLGDIIAYNMSLLNSSSRERIFGFKVLNNMNSSKGINWTLNTGQQLITSNNPAYLNQNKTVFVYVGYNYTSSGAYTVNASAISDSLLDYTRNIEVNV